MASGKTEVTTKKNRKGMNSLLVLRLRNPPKFSYCLKNRPDKMKYNGILNEPACSSSDEPICVAIATWLMTTSRIQNPLAKSIHAILLFSATMGFCQ